MFLMPYICQQPPSLSFPTQMECIRKRDVRNRLRNQKHRRHSQRQLPYFLGLSCRNRILSDGNQSAFLPYLCRTFVQLHLPCQSFGARRLLYQPHIRRVHLADACILSINKKMPGSSSLSGIFYLCHFFRINIPLH